MKNKISFIITCPYYDNGIKSLGSKCLLSIGRKKIIEKQCFAIDRFCKEIDYEIILVNSIEHYKTQKFLEKKLPNVKYVYANYENINYGGSLIKGLGLVKYPNIINIECGLIFSSRSIERFNISDSDIAIGCITEKHKQNSDLELGCTITQDNVVNLFFGLENKQIGIYYMNSQIKDFILDNLEFENHKNKFLFEIINYCIAKGYSCKANILKSKENHLVFNKKSLQQYTGII